ncbi:MAG TPA: aminotransferase class I/II-fold pyridoxal phosphate-dependent enzyme [Polyangiaceae bacterium]
MTLTTYLVKSDRPGDDPIFTINAEAEKRKAGGEPVINASLGVLLADDGSLAILPSLTRAVRALEPLDFAPYAPIAGTPELLVGIMSDLFAEQPTLREVATAVATPGGSGAIRHAIATFLEPGQALLTSSLHWSPYSILAREHDREIETFDMFDSKGPMHALHAEALERALASQLARQGRALLVLNDPCHNPTGFSMADADWAAVEDIIHRNASRGPITVLLDAAYTAFSPHGLSIALSHLKRLMQYSQVLIAWSASKSFTAYGLRVGALVALVPDLIERRKVQAALGYACRGTWSNCNRAGMTAVARLLHDPTLRPALQVERSEVVGLLNERVRAFRDAARGRLRHPRYDGGFFVTVFSKNPQRQAARAAAQGLFVVPVEGGLRVALSCVSTPVVPQLVDMLARTIDA